MQDDFNKVCQLLTSTEADGKVALQLLKGQSELKKKVEQYFEPLLKIFSKTKLNAIPAIVKKIQAHKEPKKTFLPLLQDPVFSNYFQEREELVIKNYPITSLFRLGDYPKLKKLYIQNNKQLIDLPDTLGSFENLSFFWLSASKVEVIPDDFFKGMESINALWLQNNKLKSLPKSVSNLKHLDNISLYKNEFEEVPDILDNFPELKWLNLEKNNLSDLPNSLRKCTQLKEMYLSYNKKLTKMPEFLTELKFLTRIDMTNCGLKKLPDNMDKLTQVRLLNLNNNKLTTLPDSIVNMKNLGGVLLYHNPISKEEQARLKALLPNVSFSFSS